MRSWWFLVAVSCLVLRAPDVHARDFRIERQWTFAGRAKGILDIVLAVEQKCSKGCRYRAPRVVRSIILPRDRQPESFYVWSFAEDIQNSKWFSRLTTRRDAHGTHVDLRTVPDAVARKLASESGQVNDPGFDALVVTYDIEELFVNGQFVKTQVTFTDTITVPALGAFFGAGLIRDRMAETAHAIYLDFAAVRP